MVLFVCVIFSSLVSADTSTDVNQVNSKIANLDNISYFEDVDGALGYSEISSMLDQFSPLESKPANFGFTTSTYWLHTVVKNTSSSTNDWLLNISYPLLDDIVIYEKPQNEELIIHHTGDHLPYGARDIPSLDFLLNMTLRENTSTEIIIRVASTSSMQIPLKLWSYESYTTSSHDEFFLLGLYYGTLTALFAYNLMLIFWIKDFVYVYYAGYLLCYCFFQLSINGLAFKFLWPNSIWLADRSVLFFLCLSIIFASKLSHSILQIDKLDKVLRTAYVFSVRFFMAMIPFSLFADYQIMIQILSVATVTTGLLFLCAAVMSLRAGVTTAKYYLLALFVVLSGIVLFALKSLGLAPATNVYEYTIMIGSTGEAILLSFALSHRFKVLKDDNTRMQSEAHDLLEHSVKERTKELKSVLDELSIANTRLESMNNTDTLTGVKSRAYFDEHAEFVWQKTERSNEELAIMMLDIDNFKYINDNYGHLIGDEVLIIIAQAINSSLTRATDQMARYGGEEFIVILPAATFEGVSSIAEKIRSKVETSDTQAYGLTQAVTISIGISIESPSSNNSTLRDAIERADKALYQAKHNGKNCVRIYDGADFIPREPDVPNISQGHGA